MSIYGKTCLVVVPARGGSKGILRKNLSTLGNRSLIRIVGEMVNSLEWVDMSILSSDSSEIIEEGARFGLDAIFVRPSYLSDDWATAIAVWTHAFKEAERASSQTYDFSVLLEPTSPFRRKCHVENAVKMLIEDGYDSVISLSETDSKSHPLKQFTLGNNGKLDLYAEEGRNIVARQQLAPVYHRNGAVYAITRDCLLKKGTIISDATGGFIIENPMVNIDSPTDLEWARYLWDKQEVKNRQ